MGDFRLADLHTIEAEILTAIERGEPVDAFALTLLVGRYAGGHSRRADALGIALSRALEGHQADTGAAEKAAWLILFANAMRVSDDPRLREAAGRLTEELQRTWLQSTSVDEAAPCIDACLRMSRLADPGAPEMHALASEAIDALERMVVGAYAPARGMSDTFGRDGEGKDRGAPRGGPRTQVRAAAALLTGYEVSLRLPYSMLAEELMQLMRDFGGDFGVECEAARVLARLAALHDDPDYRAAAVVAPDADYRRDGARLLAGQSSHALSLGAGGSIYALALVELEFPDWYADSPSL